MKAPVLNKRQCSPVTSNILQSGVRQSKIIKLGVLGCLVGLTITDIGR